jgi:hypothetical protein
MAHGREGDHAVKDSIRLLSALAAENGIARHHQRRIELRNALLVQRLMREEPPADQWEPMETAPLDGTPIQVRRGELKATVS